MTNEDSDVPPPLMTIREATKREKNKASKKRLLLRHDASSLVPAAESETRPSMPAPGSETHPSMPAPECETRPSVAAEPIDHITIPVTGPNSIDELIKKVLEQMALGPAPPAKRQSLRAMALEMKNREQDADDEDEDEDDTLCREKAMAM